MDKNKIKIKNEEVAHLMGGKIVKFPKYTTLIMNIANNTTKGTAPKVVGQMSDLIQEFNGETLADWDLWYKEKHPTSIDDASELVYKMLLNFKEATDKIDKAMIREWIEDLVITKTFSGLKFQSIILQKIAALKGATWRLATKEEEAIKV